VDAFGNTVSYFNVVGAADRIEVGFESVVETYPTNYRGEGLPHSGATSAPARLMLHDFLQETPLTLWCSRFMAFGPQFQHLRNSPVEPAVVEVADLIYNSFIYEGEVTTASSPIAEVLEHGRGVCQDFSHLMLATCRWLGFPARYVSGYILPEDEAPVSASHAWLEVFDPGRGWLGVDPTHNTLCSDRHVRLGVGRDFRDVPPNRGVYRGAAVESMEVKVNLRPMRSEELVSRARAAYRPVPSAQPPPRKVRPPALVTLLQQAEHQRQQQQQQQQQQRNGTAAR
jgi:transglutaminase-like putative cysteine protease